MPIRLCSIAFVIVLLSHTAPAQRYEPGEEGTFSIIGRDPETRTKDFTALYSDPEFMRIVGVTQGERQNHESD